MDADFLWNDNDVIWNDNSFHWSVYEVIAEVATNEPIRGAFIDIRKKHNQHISRITNRKEEKKYIKILCLINDKEFEAKKYINKKLKINFSNEEVTIKEIKKVNISETDVKYELLDINIGKELMFKLEDKKSDNKIKIEIKNIKMS